VFSLNMKDFISDALGVPVVAVKMLIEAVSLYRRSHEA
jgi:hypothetical protein